MRRAVLTVQLLLSVDCLHSSFCTVSHISLFVSFFYYHDHFWSSVSLWWHVFGSCLTEGNLCSTMWFLWFIAAASEYRWDSPRSRWFSICKTSRQVRWIKTIHSLDTAIFLYMRGWCIYLYYYRWIQQYFCIWGVGVLLLFSHNNK